MNSFQAAPAVPYDYVRLNIFSANEINLLKTLSYISETELSLPRRRSDFNYEIVIPEESLQDTYVKAYVIWFCYLFEQFFLLQRPLLAFEEIIVEFQAINTIDLPGRRLATRLTGAGGLEPTDKNTLLRYFQWLAPHYVFALEIFEIMTVADKSLPL